MSEAFQHLKSSNTIQCKRHKKPSDLSIRPAHGGVQFHDMLPHPNAPRNPESTGNDPITIGTSPGTEGSLPAEANVPNMPEPADRPAAESPKDQPDQEPDIPSISSRTPSHNFPDNNPQVDLPAHEVPLPETSDEGESLYVDDEMIFHLHEDHCYHFEVEINQRDIDHWKEEPRPEEMSFLVSAAKHQRSEVKISTLSPKDRQLFEDAKSKEVDSWLATSTVCRILRHQVPAENILRCRWILDVERRRWKYQHRKCEDSHWHATAPSEAKGTFGSSWIWRPYGRSNPKRQSDHVKALKGPHTSTCCQPWMGHTQFWYQDSVFAWNRMQWQGFGHGTSCWNAQPNWSCAKMKLSGCSKEHTGEWMHRSFGFKNLSKA